MRATANRAAAARGGWRPRTSRGHFFSLYIYSYIVEVPSCQFSRRLTEKNAGLYSFKASVHSFWARLYKDSIEKAKLQTSYEEMPQLPRYAQIHFFANKFRKKCKPISFTKIKEIHEYSRRFFCGGRFLVFPLCFCVSCLQHFFFFIPSASFTNSEHFFGSIPRTKFVEKIAYTGIFSFIVNTFILFLCSF